MCHSHCPAGSANRPRSDSSSHGHVPSLRKCGNGQTTGNAAWESEESRRAWGLRLWPLDYCRVVPTKSNCSVQSAFWTLSLFSQKDMVVLKWGIRWLPGTWALWVLMGNPLSAQNHVWDCPCCVDLEVPQVHCHGPAGPRQEESLKHKLALDRKGCTSSLQRWKS